MTLRSILAIAISVIAIGDCGSQVFAQEVPTPPAPQEYALVSDVGGAVQDALLMASRTGLGGLSLDSATLSLETGISRDTTIGVNFVVFTVSHHRQKGATQVTTMTFSIPHPRSAGSTIALADLKEPLAHAIASAAAISSAITTLPLSDASVKVEFVVERKTSGELSFKLLTSDTASFDFTKTAKNSLELHFSSGTPRPSQ